MAIPLVFRQDVKGFFVHAANSTLILMERIKEIVMNKGLIINPPYIPVPEKPTFVKEKLLHGDIGHIRPLPYIRDNRSL